MLAIFSGVTSSKMSKSDFSDSGFVYFLLGFANGSGFNGSLLARNHGSLVRGEASLEARNRTFTISVGETSKVYYVFHAHRTHYRRFGSDSTYIRALFTAARPRTRWHERFDNLKQGFK
uniref:Uncharacterized protein n=1 Tax=Candidatus Kentrum sp. SD TaxID=2126332 RepID=A0A450YF03_9GAMM|nr:MAG: hypothetical protein BECKSD772F_GA0070984_105315 [Candidatus Kentron sp. SD]VFK45429.1 MAG: hypothetical protein BECKSD772E_GA0070983_105315 [Candidatus Kentron sp. SD]